MRRMLVVGVLVGVCVTIGRGQGSAPRQVRLTLHEGTNMAAALSPDGRTIALDLLGTLWTMPAQGGAAKAITDIFFDARQPSWSPDGRRIAFQAYRDSTWQIWIVNADGTEPKPVTSSVFDDREPAWSPDGSRIAFSSDRGGSYDIWLLTLATGEVQRITTAESNEFMPSWRSATEVAYVSDRRDTPGIYAARATGAAASERLVAAGDGALAAPAFGPDGTVAFNAIAGGRSRLMVAIATSPIPTRTCFRSVRSFCPTATCSIPPTARSSGVPPRAVWRASSHSRRTYRSRVQPSRRSATNST